jgi:hypothetical protein
MIPTCAASLSELTLFVFTGSTVSERVRNEHGTVS